MSAIDAVMQARSIAELERIVIDDAPGDTEEALAAARAELTRRGKDVSGLVPRRGAPRGAPPESKEKVRRFAVQAFGAFLVLGLGSALLAPLRGLASAASWISALLAPWSISR